MTQPELAAAEPTDASGPPEPSPEELRGRMVNQLIEEGMLDDPAIEAAFRAVPREAFAPLGTPAELPYAIRDVVSVTVDIDQGVTARATAGLDQIGLGGRVEVITADAGRHQLACRGAVRRVHPGDSVVSGALTCALIAYGS
ncbi:hypothetical protein AB1046_07705 [Promicromonospora sp. Populi]|uniref:hypothetical protein n=1 Tax=Promicromonospora sp. Populi TaxID=3239420 RepID=UPI0034E2656A